MYSREIITRRLKLYLLRLHKLPAEDERKYIHAEFFNDRKQQTNRVMISKNQIEP